MAMSFSVIMLASLIIAIIISASHNIVTTEALITVSFDQELIDNHDYSKIAEKANPLLANNDAVTYQIIDYIKAHKQVIGTTAIIPVIVNNKLKDKLNGKSKFNFNLLTNNDSREIELAGIKGALIGSVLMIIIAIIISLPVGILTAIYFAELAPKNNFINFLELFIINLASIPSIVFGIVGLSVFINYFGLPRSSSLAGGLTLSLMILPIIIITTKNALRRVPTAIRESALALGASKQQMIFHHLLPIATPSIMTGAILSISRAIGETAPLMLLGMVAFISETPKNIFDQATALPVQIFLWSESIDQEFTGRTSAAILVLMILLVLINLIAVIIRKKFERD